MRAGSPVMSSLRAMMNRNKRCASPSTILTSAANPNDDRVSIGARGLTGDAYLGHVFWDTEIYLLPFYTAV